MSPRSAILFWLQPLLVFAFALLLRLPGLESRPVHPDEAVNAHILAGLLGGEGYHYQSHDHHGPSLYHLAASVLRVTGPDRLGAWELWMLRLFPAVAGAALAALAFVWLSPHFGRVAALGSAFFLSLSAPFVYYGGCFIHETLVLFFLLGWLACAWRGATSGGVGPALLGGLCAGLLLATKETGAPLMGLLGLAVIVTTRPPLRRLASAVAIGGAVALVVIVLFYSEFGRHPERAFDLFSAVGSQVGRGLGQEHAYPWFTYARWFLAPAPVGWPWSTWLLLGFGGFGLWTQRRSPLAQALALGCGLLAVFFSVLPYKTPWLMLAILLPLALLAGLGAAALATRLHDRRLVILAGLLLTGLLGTETYQRCLRHAVDPANPLAYSPGSPDLARLEADLAARAAAASNPSQVVQVIARDYWPLPWTLRRFATGYWPETPDTLRPGFVIVSPENFGTMTGRAGEFSPYEIRPGLILFLGRVH